MSEDRRQEQDYDAPRRRYDDAKAASASAADRIARAAADTCAALRSLVTEEERVPLPWMG